MNAQLESRPMPLDTLDETRLVARLRAGDEEAFEVMVRTYGGRLLAVARRFVRDEDEAKDVLQTAYLSAFRALSEFEGNCQLSTWLHRMTVNQVLMHFRRRGVQNEKTTDDGEMPEQIVRGTLRALHPIGRCE